MPVGTQVLADDDERTLLADLTEEGQRVTLLKKGGLGGRGNASYKSSTNRAPRQHQTGMDGEELWLWLRLKLPGRRRPARAPQRRQVDLPQLE